MVTTTKKASTPAKRKPAKGASSTAKKKAKKATGGGKEDTVEIIRSYLYGMHQAGMSPVDEKDVLLKTKYSRTDSTGYRDAMKELVKELKHVVKSKGLALTDKGIQYIEKNGLRVKVMPATMEEHQKDLQSTIFENAKAPEKALLDIWTVLIDGVPHTRDELLEAAGYKRPDSTGYREIMKWLNKLDLVEKVQGGSSFQFTDKVYRYGSRPGN